MAHIRVLIESIRLCAKQLKEAHRQLDRLCKLLAEPIASEDGKTAPEQEQVQRAVAILKSLPGAGRIVLAVLLAEAFDTLQRADYAILRILCGVAPVTRRSGKSRAVTRRLACNPRLRNASDSDSGPKLNRGGHLLRTFVVLAGGGYFGTARVHCAPCRSPLL